MGVLPGWRFAFLSVGILSICIGVLQLLFGYDPVFDADTKPPRPTLRSMWNHLLSVLGVPSFRIIVVQVGSPLKLTG